MIKRNGLFIAIIIAVLFVSCTLVLVRNKTKTKSVEKKIEIKALNGDEEKKN